MYRGGKAEVKKSRICFILRREESAEPVKRERKAQKRGGRTPPRLGSSTCFVGQVEEPRKQLVDPLWREKRMGK